MNKLSINIKCKKRENKYIKPFVEFYISSYLPQIKEIDVDCPDKNNQQKLPDYYLRRPKILVEIKEVHERKQLEVSIAWSHNIRRLERDLESRNLNSIRGSYLVNTPTVLRVKEGKEKKVNNEIIKAIENNQKEVDILDLGKFEIHKYSDIENIVGFGLIGPGRWIDPAGTIHQNIGLKIGTANEQLGSFKNGKADRKILLLVNKYIFGNRISEFIEALTYSYDSLLRYKNIDEIWLQVESQDGKFLHTLLYTRNFLTAFDKKGLIFDRQTVGLFEKWFYPLSKLGDKFKEKLFAVLKKLLENKKPYRIFPDKFIREEMVRLGIWLAEKRELNDTIWIIDRFMDDPDPVEPPEDYVGDPDFNYHLQIKKKTEEPIVITTVQGHLAWVVQKLALHKNYIDKAFNYTQKTLRTRKNLYTIQQWLVPLVEISNRRLWLTEKNYLDFRSLVLDELLEKYAAYPALAKYLVHIFYYFKGLTTEEVEKVLTKLQYAPEVEVLFIFFALFRKRYYKDKRFSKAVRDYNPAKAIARLKKKIADLSPKNEIIRGGIAWHLWKILHNEPEEFETIAPWIDEFLKYTYTKNACDDLLRIVEEWIERKPRICINWFCLILDKISKFVDTKEKGREFWLTTKTGYILGVIAQKDPKKLIGIVRQLVRVWKLGSFVGSPKEIFDSYKEISDEKLKLQAKKKFQAWYKSMKKLNPKLEEVDWD